MRSLQILARLNLSLALLGGFTSLQAQLHPAPNVNLFGDEVVQKLRTERGMQHFVRAVDKTDEEKPTPAVEGYAHTLILHDGSQIRGEVVSLNKTEILWSRPDVSEPIRLRREDIRRIILTPPPPNSRSGRAIFHGQAEPPEDKSKSGFATVKLPGGDWLHGDLSSPDGKTFSLKIGEHTNFTLNRDGISWLHSGANPAPAFGFSGRALDMEGWLVRSPGAQIEVKEGTLTVKGTNWIGRDVSSIRRFEMTFELPEDGEDSTQVWLQPHGPSVNSYSSGTIQITLGRREFRHMAYNNQMATISTPLPKEMGESKGPVRYRILYDGVGERMVVFRNGHQIGDWKFRDEKENGRVNSQPFQVSGICFQRQYGQDKPLKLNRIQIQPWDGVLSANESAGGEGDCLLSTDGKTRIGHLEALTKDEITFSGEKSGRKNGAFLQFAHESAPLAEADTMLLFGEQGEISTADLEISDGKARFRTVFAPTLEASLSTLQTIAFPMLSKVAEAKPADILVFKNGDELPGFLISAVTGEPWRWQTMSGQEFTVRPDYIAGFRAFAGNAVSEPPKNFATVELRNGDRLRGELSGFTEGKIQFRHAELGAFGLDQDQLWSLYPNPNLLILDGSQQPSKWMGLNIEKTGQTKTVAPVTHTGNRWVYLDGSYILRPEASSSNSSSGNLMASIDQVPERFELRCDVTSTSGSEPNMSIMISSKTDGGQLQAQISYGRLYAYTFSRKSRGSRSRQVQFTDKFTDPTTRRNIRIFVDSKLGTADFFLDGVFLTRIGQQESERLPGMGNTIRLQPYPQEGSVVLSNIWIGPWNGELPSPGAEPAPSISLTNGDVAIGAPTDFRDGKLLLDSEIGPLEVPMDKVLAVEFGGTFSPKTPAARVRLADGCAIAVESFRWEGGQLIAGSEVLGNLQIPAKLISELILAPAPARGPKNPPGKRVAQEARAE